MNTGLQNNSHQASNLAFADSFVSFRLFASVFGFASQMTLEMTRRERLLVPLLYFGGSKKAMRSGSNGSHSWYGRASYSFSAR